MKLKNLRVHFDNLFNGQKALEAVGNQVINDNIATYISSFIPPIERAIEKKVLKASNQVFEKAPASDYFP